MKIIIILIIININSLISETLEDSITTKTKEAEFMIGNVKMYKGTPHIPKDTSKSRFRDMSLFNALNKKIKKYIISSKTKLMIDFKQRFNKLLKNPERDFTILENKYLKDMKKTDFKDYEILIFPMIEIDTIIMHEIVKDRIEDYFLLDSSADKYHCVVQKKGEVLFHFKNFDDYSINNFYYELEEDNKNNKQLKNLYKLLKISENNIFYVNGFLETMWYFNKNSISIFSPYEWHQDCNYSSSLTFILSCMRIAEFKWMRFYPRLGNIK